MSESKNLVEGLTDEILRVTEIKREYEAIPNGAGKFGSMLMEAAISNGRKAQASGDVIEMIGALKDLQEFEL